MEFALSYFPAIPIADRELIRVYAALDAELVANGTKLGKNDLWIAATAVAMGRRLLTTDKDFGPLDPKYLQRVWIDPAPPP